MKRAISGMVLLMVLALPGLVWAETAVYSATYTAPQCATGVSPCEVPSSLINGRDNMSGGIEPNQPNTLVSA